MDKELIEALVNVTTAARIRYQQLKYNNNVLAAEELLAHILKIEKELLGL